MNNPIVDQKLADDFRAARVAILGRPNAGKSTLLNALLDTRVSAVSSKPQTTRTNIKGMIPWHTGKGKNQEWAGQIVLVDTPGVNFKKGLLDRFMYSAVEDALRNVDIVLWVVDSRTWTKDLTEIEARRPGSDKLAGWLTQQLKKAPEEQKWICVLNKADEVKKPVLLPLMERTLKACPKFSDVFPVAALQGRKSKSSNILELIELLKKLSPSGTPYYPEDSWTDLTDRQMIQNLVREAIFQQSREEVPYQTDCTILSYEEPSGVKKKPEVHVTLWVGKASLKPILVGRNGSKIKEIGTMVRERYKEVTGDDIVLKTFVKVVDKWDSRAKNLEELGYVSS